MPPGSPGSPGSPEASGTFPRNERYECIEELGVGSMGVVYKAHDREMMRDVALKTLRRADAETLFLLKREFRSLADLSHPGLVQLYDLVVSDEDCFFTMEWVPGQGLLHSFRTSHDWTERRDLFVQLLRALQALHAAGKLHRDVKPANVRVDPSGRVVLLDFGLVIGMDHRMSLASQVDGFAGTLAYTSPEQAWGRPIGPSADLYSMGVMLYESLTGRLPFDSGLGALLDRRENTPEPPASWEAGIPAPLAELALALLAYEPEDRPSLEEALLRLSEAPSPTPRTRPATAGGGIVGRQEELAQLRAAFRNTRSGHPSIVLVAGASGMGKTALLEAFVNGLERDEEAVVLRSRCHPQQSVRFEAIDGIVDDLSRFLLHDGDKAASYLPAALQPLIRLFPVLARAKLEIPGEPPLIETDLQEIRRRAFASLRDMLTRIAMRRPLVLWIDDLQWGDIDSVPLLRELLRPPDLPPLLLIASIRAEDQEGNELVEALRGDQDHPFETLALGPLGLDDAETLLDQLVGSSERGDTSQTLAAEAGGSPFFLGELARHLREHGRDSSTRVELQSVIGDRVRTLPAEARRLLEVVAVSRRPIDLKVALEIAGSGRRGMPRIFELWNQSLLRTDGSAAQLDVYHGRIREAVIDEIGAERRIDVHRHIAEGLEASGDGAAEAILENYLAAGERDRAAPHALDAAQQADQALAFHRAAELYTLAFELRGEQDADHRLLEQSAAALAAAGFGGEAAPAYRRAVDVAVEGGVSGAHVAVLRTRCAAQHFYAGDLVRGTAELRLVLEELGIPFPATPGRARAAAAWFFARFLLRGSRFRPRSAESVPAEALLRLDALQGVERGTTMLDHTLSSAIAGRSLLTALSLGEPSRALRALALQAGTEANLGGRWLRGRAMDLLERVDELAEQTGDPYDAAWAASSRSAVAWFMGHWAECAERSEHAQELLRSGCLGATWELVTNHSFAISAMVQQGNLRRLAERLPQLEEEARGRSDAYASVIYGSGDSVVTELIADAPERAAERLRDSGSAYADGDFHSLHFQHLIGEGHLRLYSREAGALWERIESTWPALERSGFLFLDCVGNGLRHLRGRAAVAAAGDTPLPGERARLIAIARAEATRIDRSTLPHSSANAAAVRAGALAVEGRDEDAARELAGAARAYRACGMRIYAEAAEWQRARLTGDTSSAARAAEAEDWFVSQGVAQPAAMVRMMLPLG